MKRVVIGMIGNGFASHLHLTGYKRLSGVEVVVKSIAAACPLEELEAFAQQHGIAHAYLDYQEMLADPEIDVIDVITPPSLHEEMIINALNAGKHVITEKPLTGYFYEDAEPGQAVSKADMYGKVMEKLARIRQAVQQSGKLLMYAENWVYAPVVLKSAELITAKKNKILYMHAEESHSGSHAYHAANWKYNGGGSLIRQGCHPITAILFLKQTEAAARGESIRVQSVLCDVGNVAECLKDSEKQYIDSRPVDVEDIADLMITFSDGTKAHIVSADMLVGGMKNCLDIYANDAVHRCKMNPNDAMTVYHANEEGLQDTYFTEKLGTKQGWQYLSVEEDTMRGYLGEFQDFMECVTEGRRPLSGIDLAYDTAQVIYAAYQSADEGRRIVL